MPQSKKDAKKNARAAAVKAGTALEIVNGKPAKPPQQTTKCVKCFGPFTVSGKNQQLKDHVAAKHPNNSFAECFPDVPAS